MSTEFKKLTVAIPTLNRSEYLVSTINQLLVLSPPPHEIIVVDQTQSHPPEIQQQLDHWRGQGKLVWRQLPKPDLMKAMNIALQIASHEIVLFLDDDITINPRLVDAHLQAHKEPGVSVVAGQIIQPWEKVLPLDGQAFRNGEIEDPDAFNFNSAKRRYIHRVMAGNMSLKRSRIVELGGFDENFKGAAYRFEAEFAYRVTEAGDQILFDPAASIDHIKAETGGTSSFGKHYKTLLPRHSVGEYYYLFKCGNVKHRFQKAAFRPIRTLLTRFHLKNVWWIPLTFVSEIGGLFWAGWLYLRGPRYLEK